MSALRWTCKSTYTLARELNRKGFLVSSTKVGQLLKASGYALQSNLEIVVSLISATKTETGLEVHAWVDDKEYKTKQEVTETQLNEVNIVRNKFHGEWNYEIRPSKVR